MTPEDMERLRALMSSRAGMELAKSRAHLAAHRLGPVARREGFESVEAMLEALWARPVASLAWSVIEAMLNTETWFRRDRAGFDTLERELLPALAKARAGRPIRILSAGCATGQEAYSAAIVAAEAGAEVEVHGVDLSHVAIERATPGVYSAFEIQRGLSAALMLKYFDKAGEAWRAREPLRRRVAFARANLLDAVQDDTPYDVILCRHVITDMAPGRRGLVLDGLEQRLTPDGCLFLAPGERVEDDTVAFRPVAGRKGLYVKRSGGLQRAA